MSRQSKDLLVEIGVEELPAGYILPALDSWSAYLGKSLSELKLALPETVTEKYSTPRRLTLHIKNIKVRQEDEKVEKVGPAVNVAFDQEGNLSKAGQGFLRGAKVDIAGLNYEVINDNKEGTANKPYLKTTKKGDYIAVTQTIMGMDAEKLLSDVCKQSLAKISFPKMMRWKEKKFRFARPVRWILALFGGEVLSFTAAGVNSGRVSYGNVFGREAEPVTLKSSGDYPEMLRNHGVIADRDERLSEIDRQVRNKAAAINGTAEDKALLEEVTDIVEYPTAVLSHFPEEYLKLPEKVVYSTLVKNQRYFPVYNKEGGLQNCFIYIANNLPEYAENTAPGNERVVNARLADARFYYEEDLALSAEFFNNKLKGMVFHAKAGSIGDKVDRIIEISRFFCEMFGLDESKTERTLKAASLCKFDLATSMVGEKEFTALQGYVGKVYASMWGEDEEIAAAIEEHYLPVGLTNSSAKADIPASIMGQVVSLADKLDTLCALFGIGLIPTGSKDQYALRRTGSSIVKLIYEAGLEINIRQNIQYIFKLLSDKLPAVYDLDKVSAAGGTIAILYDFLKQRIGQYLQQADVKYDVINAVLAVNYDDIVKTINRAKALQGIRDREDFEHLMLSFKRVTNIISQEKEFVNIEEDLLLEPAEQALYQSLVDTREKVAFLLTKNDFSAVLELFIAMNQAIDTFFDDVLVNDENVQLRKNRYALLNLLRELFLNIGDLSLIVVEERG